MKKSKPQKIKALVLGDIMLDITRHGEVTRVSPEAPVPILSLRSEIASLGGAGNVAMHLFKLGVDTRICGTIGADSAGRKVIELVSKHCHRFSLIEDDTISTTVKERIVSDGHQIVRIDSETVKDAHPVIQDKIVLGIKALCSGIDVAVISDYGKGTLNGYIRTVLYQEAAVRGFEVINAIHSGARIEDCVMPHEGVFLANIKDLCKQLKLSPLSDPDHVLNTVVHRTGCRPGKVVMTNGAEGVYYWTTSDRFTPYKLEAIKGSEIAQRQGVSDVFAAALVPGVAHGKCFAACVDRANSVAAAYAVGKWPVAT